MMRWVGLKEEFPNRRRAVKMSAFKDQLILVYYAEYHRHQGASNRSKR